MAKPPTATIAALVQPQQQHHHQQQQQQQQQKPHLIDLHDASTHLPTALGGLKVRNPQKQQQQHNSNSLLKQQLRAGLKDIEANGSITKSAQNSSENMTNNDTSSCSALQSLATAAVERQAPNAIQPPSANNLHHQFLLHMAANPMLKSSNDFFQQQQQQSQQQQQQQQREDELHSSHLELMLDQNDKSEPELTLADESAGLDYKSSENSANDSGALTPASTHNKQSQNSNNSTMRHGGAPRPIQRRRIRRKAQSTLDDQAEHLTEMSVRGLDLFRYASITEGVYQCTECLKENVQKTFKNKYSFQRHAFLYHEGKHRKVFPCPVCGKEFSRPDKMKNHMKMIHESFVTKEISNFNPLNYLITAAAAGDIHSTLFPQLQQQQQAGVMMGEEELGVNLTQTTISQSLESPTQITETDTMPTPAEALLRLQNNDIIIKNEIVISPSPSPPPMGLVTTQPPTQRLEEVK